MFRSIHNLRNLQNTFRFRQYSSSKNIKSSNLRNRLFLAGLCGATGAAIYYDASTNDLQRFRSANRFFKSLKIALLISLDYSWHLKGLKEESPEYDEVLHEVHLRSAERLLNGCLINGGLYVKIGQGVASINHILPKEYTDTLKKLEDQCLPRSPDEVTKLFLEDFGKKPEEIFETFDHEPIAAASLAQVFKATTKNGEIVAVKVQYKDLQKRFKTDIGTILFLQSLVALVHKNYNFGWIIEDLKDALEMELDFNNEAKNAEKCAADLANLDFVHIPKVYWDLSGLRVLTAEYIEGFKISDLQRIEREKLDLGDVDSKLFKMFSEQIFRTGFVHADPHPGNVFVRKNKNGKAELVLLDHGLYQTLTVDTRENLCYFWEALVRADYEAMKKYAAALEVSDHMRFAEILLQRPMSTRPTPISTKYTEEDLVFMKKLAKKRFDIIMDVLKDMPRSLIFVVRNLNTVRAIAREHGDPVDRPKVMARCAITCLLHRKNGISGYFSYMTRKIHFEYRLWKMSFNHWLHITYIEVLTMLGRAPPDTKSLFDINLEV